MSGVLAECCVACGHAGIEPRGFCPRCGSRDLILDMISGEGVIWALTEIHRLSSDEAPGPRTIGVVALTAGPRVMAKLPRGLKIADRVIVSRTTLDGEPTVSPI